MRYHVKPYEGPNRCCVGAHGVYDEAGLIVAKCDNRTVEQADQHGNRKRAEAIAQALNEREELLVIKSQAENADVNWRQQQIIVDELRAERDKLLRCRAVAQMVVTKVESGRMHSRETYALAKAALERTAP